jgi:hypothetical protein
MARLLALLLGTVLAAILFVTVWRIWHPPVQMQDVELHVTDARGVPVDAFKWDYWDETPGAVLNPYVPNPPHPGGTAIARVPRHQLRIDVRCKGLATARIGPFDPQAIPSHLDVVLPDLEVVSGVVTYSGRPIAGVAVLLVWDHSDLLKGIPSGLFSGDEDLKAITDETGSFRIGTEGGATDYWVKASKEGYATGTSGPAHLGDPPLDVLLHDGGTIEGVLQLPDGKDPNTTQVELYRRDPADYEIDVYGHFISRPNSTGVFRFEHIDEGPWLARLLRPKVTQANYKDRSPGLVPFIVEVKEGETTHLEMDLTQPLAQLEGRPTIIGKPWRQAYAYLHLIGKIGLTLDEAASDDEGGWSLRVRAPGKYRLVIWGNHQHDTSVPYRVSDIVEITQTPSRWDPAISWGNHDSPEFRMERFPGDR